jgi:hypothetical protein
MKREFDSALKKIAEREDKQSTRFIYWIWDLVKEPSKILTAIGDKLVGTGRDEYVIGRAIITSLSIESYGARTKLPQ